MASQKFVTHPYTAEIFPDTENNTITASGNFRIITLDEPLTNVLKITQFEDNVTILESQEPNLKKYIRYSKDGIVWSMWYAITDFESSDITTFSTMEFNPDDELYFAFKYEYDDGTHDEIEDIISIDYIKIQFTLRVLKPSLALNAKVAANCTPEQCTDVLFDRNAQFDLYDIGNLGDFYLSMSTAMQLYAGLPALYFQTSPDPTGTDYVFREYSLYNIIQRKCIKVIVNKNEFPDASFIYNGVGMEYTGPFEIHLDKRYFESMFGTGKEPRKKDFLYLPLMNRMYEIQDVEMVRGLMMMPIYWKANLVKFRPNINLLADKEQSEFLDNMILDSEEQFGQEAADQTADAVNPQQTTTVSPKTDEVREYLDRAVKVRVTDINYNYTRMINYYYSLNVVNTENSDGHLVIYKEPAEISEGNDSTYVFSFNIPSSSEEPSVFLTTTEDEKIKIYGQGLFKNGTAYKYTMFAKIGGSMFKLDLSGKVSLNKWYCAVIGVSPTYKQVEMYVYSFAIDEFDGNVTGFTRENSALFVVPADEITVETDGTYCLNKTNANVANIRIFNRNMEFEKHEFILSQLFIKDESMLRIIDNCRPRLGMPYIMKKY